MMAIIGMGAMTRGSGQSPFMTSAAISEARAMAEMMLMARIAVMPNTRAVLDRGTKTKKIMAIADIGWRTEMTRRDQISAPSAKEPTAAANKAKETLTMARTIMVLRKAVMVGLYALG